GTHVCEIRDGKVFWNEHITIPYTPMLGCLGTAPGWGSPTTGPPGPHGGNKDIKKVAPGRIGYLPVFVSGAYLYHGDAHAAMGDGELSATGLEMPSATIVKVDLLKTKRLPAPRIQSPSEIITVASGCPMERSTAQAYAWLILWLEEEYGWN